ncbi:hypothetical protein [Streptomyces cyaneofuscatus]|uniref:hypothetical protein n=1 Tax=Streptomyces cyaneofuscatus TaxID=66883 RepID=UPI0037B7C92D
MDLVVRQRQSLGPTARRAGLTAWALRKDVFEHPEMVAVFGTPGGGPEQEKAGPSAPGSTELWG